MKPIYLYMQDTMGHEVSELDLSSISAALVVGRVDGNDLHSNGSGKSTIFRAIIFCLFNETEKGFKLEKFIRDDTNKCKVVFDFESDNKIYRISRSRTRKGITDLSLFERTSYSELNVNPHCMDMDEVKFKQFWNDISGRRIQDTEETLFKIHKMTFKSFCSGYYFMQNDYTSGLATATKSERKEILKGSLSLVIYNQLNKVATAKASVLSKEIDKKKAVLESIGDPKIIIDASIARLSVLEPLIQSKTVEVSVFENKANEYIININKLNLELNVLSQAYNVVVQKQKEIESKLIKNKELINEYSDKRKNIIASAKSLGEELTLLKDKKSKLLEIDYSLLDGLKVELQICKDLIAAKNALIVSIQESLIELKIPLPNEAVCKHCRQPLTDAHKRECEKSTNEEISKKESNIVELKKEILINSQKSKKVFEDISNLENNKKQLDLTISNISNKEKELSDKKVLFTDYDSIIKKQKSETDEINVDLESAKKKVEASSTKELNELQKVINIEKNKLVEVKDHFNDNKKYLTSLTNEKVVLEHSILEKKKEIQRKEDLIKELLKLEEEYSVLPDIIEAFGATGIPNLIIQNILDDYQIEVNSILEKIKPGLQLNFLVEKTKGDGQLDDDLEIEYFLNGKSRDYPQLSGAQKISVMVAFKLGLAFLHKKALGATMQMLLIDEVDPALDKAGVDTFAEIIKIFQKDFTILVITHNDRLKDKFSHAILVEQDQNMVSTAKIVSSW